MLATGQITTNSPNKFRRRTAPIAFLPFSAGSRNCIGQSFAMAELKIITAKLIKNFQVSLQAGYEINLTFKVVLAASDNVPLIFKPIN